MPPTGFQPPWRHYQLEDLDWIDLGEGWQRASVTLGETDTADNPVSTKRASVFGPATVTYHRAPDGGITVRVAALDAAGH